MARTKTRYRQFKDGGRVDLSGQAELPIEPPLEQPVEAVSAPPEAPAVDASQKHRHSRAAARAAAAGRRNARAEAADREPATIRAMRQQASKRPCRSSRCRERRGWRHGEQQGISNAEANFFVRNPEMLDLPQLTGFAIHKALEAGHPRGTDAHFDFVKKAFDANLAHLQGQAAHPAMQPTTPTPAFFAPPSGTISAEPVEHCQRSGQP